MNFEQITMSDDEGRFPFRTLNPGAYQITAEAPNFSPVTRDIPVSSRLTVENIHFRSVSSVQKISVVEPTSDALTPDPSERTFLHSNCSKRILAGQEPQSQFPACRSKRHPAESKLHSYFAPGVAGDHGEPITQYLQIGNLFFPNNLPAKCPQQRLRRSEHSDSVEDRGASLTVER